MFNFFKMIYKMFSNITKVSMIVTSIFLIIDATITLYEDIMEDIYEKVTENPQMI